MKVTIDEQEYNLDFMPLISRYATLYQAIRTVGIPLKDGKIFVLSQSSLLLTFLKGMATKRIIPHIQDMYDARGMELRKRVKHEDLIDYCFGAMLNYLEKNQEYMSVILTSEVSEDNRRNFITYLAAWQEARGDDIKQISQPDPPSSENL